ncbi:MAG: sigma 54 modulation/S30EA ribosomal C-terminal domain-containing protein [Micromonosporaceae bacterium]|nr:sigma 54 modulation/S30EA ribosomal C-terminal domain-containing protein [Micromonosporaceae bacterium]
MAVTLVPIASSGGEAGLTVQVRGGVSTQERDSAEEMVRDVLARHRRVVADARVRVSGAACGGPGLVQVNLRVCGAPARVQVPGPTVAAAIATAASRLDRQITRLSTTWQAWPWPDPERRSLGLPGAGRIVREKAYRLRVARPCQAAATLHAMDYDVFLYTDVETGEDAVVYRAGPVGLALARQATMRPPMVAGPLALTVNPRKTPVLTRSQAARWLADGWLPFLFFTDPDTGRGNLLYRRYDGNLGLVTPVLARVTTAPGDDGPGDDGAG